MKGDELIDERALRIPGVMAAKHGRGDGELEDLIEGECTLALVVAARDFDPSLPASDRTFRQYAFYRCTLKARELVAQVVRRRELLAENVSARDSVPAEPPPTEAGEVLRRALAKLDPVQKALYTLRVAEGETFEVIGARLGITAAGARSRFEKIRGRVRKTASRIGCKRGVGNLKPIPPPRTENQRKAAAEFCRKRAEASRLLGIIPHASYLWYAANHDAKTLVGPEMSLLALRRLLLSPDAIKRKPETSIAELKAAGWDAVRGPEALELSRQRGYRLTPPTPDARKEAT